MNRHILSLSYLLALAMVLAGPLGCGRRQTLTSIKVKPPAAVAVSGSTPHFTIDAAFSNGVTVSSWTMVSWSSSDPAVATVSPNGVVAALAPGGTVLTAIDNAHPELRTSATLTVTETPLVDLRIDPVDALLSAPASTLQLGASGTFADGTIMDLTTAVTWSSSRTDVATVSNEAGSQGVVTAVSAGSTVITALEPMTPLSAVTTVTVTSQ